MKHQIKDLLHSSRLWVALAVLAPIGMLMASGAMLIELRQDAWSEAQQTASNLLQVIARDVDRNIEVIDLSLQGAVENLHAPKSAEATPELRQRILFDRAATARDIGVMLILDENGDAVFDANGVPPRTVNNSDRDYFQWHKKWPDLGLHISRPVISRLTGVPITVLSRRINKPDGSFGGIVLASLRLSYFVRLCENLGLGSNGGINLYLRDGTRLVRYPYSDADVGVNIAGTPNFDRFVAEGSGSFVGKSTRDGVERLYTFTQIGELPLVLNVGLATADIEGKWRSKAAVIAAVMVVLCGLAGGLALLFGRELRRRTAIQAELARLSSTDALTGLFNRRHFDYELERALGDARRNRKSLSLLIVDADHFKSVNDRHGHIVGDEVLKGLARGLSASVHRPGDLVCRLGGEEFAIILQSTDRDGALIVSQKVHSEIRQVAVEKAGISAGSVTVSIGLAVAGQSETMSVETLYQRADGALYEAKANGRNQTRCAVEPAENDQQPHLLRLVKRS
ncbi:sensor domain-containing diguanylate cyclase [Hansschlegelia quercus]|uniref:sensor domain-containing diguanylate cyclase n=1 Tax=Hansschlegelia quercus TaxID=2528245 RepID=UPI003A90F697